MKWVNIIGAMLLFFCFVIAGPPALAGNHGQQIPPPEGEEQPVVCSVNVEEHMLLPTLALNENTILRYAEHELSAFWRWWYGLATATALAAADPLKADDIRIQDATNPAHGDMHQRLGRVLHIAKVVQWPGLMDGFANKVEAKLVQPQTNVFGLGVMVGLIGLAGLLWARRRRPLGYQAA